ncbi:hypothetical protein PROFUN_05909 [Planoprotostelium fungivorum]|uniref:Protein kinase domain-containing protein n=1 Tax=Planoprotostelium fungivorum TaxID=1890364 RepID=A0A2P6N7K6_9EUKA|nr:hypothetical protein PROFUN_05909 [Planoprotostelium fungivorum]
MNTDLREWLSQHALLIGPILDATLQIFEAEEILEPADVISLNAQEMEAIGIKLGTRKKILEGISRFKEYSSSGEGAQGTPQPQLSHSISSHNSPLNSDADVPSRIQDLPYQVPTLKVPLAASPDHSPRVSPRVSPRSSSNDVPNEEDAKSPSHWTRSTVALPVREATNYPLHTRSPVSITREDFTEERKLGSLNGSEGIRKMSLNDDTVESPPTSIHSASSKSEPVSLRSESVVEPIGRNERVHGVNLLGCFYDDHSQSMSSYEAHLEKKKNEPDKKNRETFLKSLSSSPMVAAGGDLWSMGGIFTGVTTADCGDNTISAVDGETKRRQELTETANTGRMITVGSREISPIVLGSSQPLNQSVFEFTPATEFDRFERASSGPFHSVAVCSNGKVHSWGYNINCSIIGINGEENKKRLQIEHNYEIAGQLGRGKGYFKEPGPVKIPLPSGVHLASISCGGVHTGAVLTDGSVYMWGLNHEGQLGLENSMVKNSKTGRSKLRTVFKKPTLLISLKSQVITQIACGGHHTIAVNNAGMLFGWGYNNHGQLGQGGTIPTSTSNLTQFCVHSPTIIPLVKMVKNVAAGTTHSMSLFTDGTLFSWGSNTTGELGRRTKKQNEPGEVLFPTAGSIDNVAPVIVQISAGSGTSACVSDNGRAYVWGRLSGEKMASHQLIPRLLSSKQAQRLFFTNVSCGYSHYCLLDDHQYTSSLQFMQSVMDEDNRFLDTEVRDKMAEIPLKLLRNIQDRAIQRRIEKNIEAPWLTCDVVETPSFRLERETTTSYVDAEITNPSAINANVRTMTIQATSHTVDVNPSVFQLKAHKSQRVRITINCAPGAVTESSFQVISFIAESVGRSKTSGKYFFSYNVTPNYIPSSLMSKRNTMQSSSNSAPSDRLNVRNLKNEQSSYDFDTVEIFEKLGTGGSGASVYRCSLQGFTCAVKILNLQDALPETQSAFLDEVLLIETLYHDNIVRYLGHDLKDNKVRLFMEYYPFSLHSVIQKRRGVPFPYKQITKCCLSVAKGLAYLHFGEKPIVHRDLKSGNVLVALDEQDCIKLVKITDFDTSRVITEENNPSTVAGTPAFIAPEVYNKSKGYSVQSDIWSFGMLIVELLTLKTPYHHMNQIDIPDAIMRGIMPPVPTITDHSLEPIIQIMNRCLSMDPLQRPNSKQLVTEFAFL